jgi:transcriptional regulator with XRE-family HTH domain
MPKSPDPTDKHVGTRVRMRRLMLGVTQTTLADALGLTFQQVQKYEKGVNRISASKLQQISNFLQVPIPFFFEGLPGPSSKSAKKGDALLPSDVYQFVATSDGLSLAKSFTRIRSPQLRRCIVSLVESLPSKASR